ncbi:MAG: CRISPR-associated endonuclease Cas1 [Thermoanaerobaculia bacterium]|nr:CRISPR-associated endonuclease Cas1 [Thermoanaerobaculia bacterium]
MRPFTVPPFNRYLFRLRLEKTPPFPFYHGAVLHGLAKAALGVSELPPGFTPFPAESGLSLFEAGSPYNFGLTLAGEARRAYGPFVSGLALAGARKPDPGAPLPILAGNFTVEEVRQLPAPSIEAESSRLEGLETATVQLLSPLRLRLPREARRNGHEFADASSFDPSLFLDSIWKRILFLSDVARDDRPASPFSRPGSCSGLRFRGGPFLRMTVPLTGKHREEGRGRSETASPWGLLGEFSLLNVPREAWLPLTAGEYLHTGGKTRYGFGRYRVLEQQREEPYPRSRSLLEIASAESRLEDALESTCQRSEAPGVDGMTPETFAAAKRTFLPALASSLRDGSFEPGPLLGLLMEKDSGGVRALAVPTVADRVAGRAVSSVLTPAVETLLEDCSHGYRHDYSRRGAAEAIQKAYREGFRFVLDADITSFFDSVRWDLLSKRLRALYPGDPLTALVEKWIQAPVVFHGQTIERVAGLPQGSPLSPLLANLFLDEFDEELLGADFRLVRFADDFVILSKDLAHAEAAKKAAETALAALGLSLNEEKTGIRSLDAGFTYLGYIFCKSMVLEREKEAATVHEGNAGAGLRAEDLPRNSWLTQVPLSSIRRLPRPGKKSEVGPEIVPLSEAPPEGYERSPLYLTSPAIHMELKGDAIRLEAPPAPPRTVPLQRISHLVFVGRPRATVPVLLALSHRGVPSYFCGRDGKLAAALEPQEPDWTVWMAQARFLERQEARAAFARSVVRAKLHNAAALLVRAGMDRASADEIRALETQCLNKEDMDTIRGLEGRGAVVFFGAVRESLAREWGFSGRKKHPSTDPVNSMLSLGYTVLLGHVATGLAMAGLNPRLGIFHEERGTRMALGCDLQEEFRSLVDGYVLGLIRQGRVRRTDFEWAEDETGACFLSGEFRRTFFVGLEKRFTESISEGDGVSQTYLQLFHRQALRVKEVVTGRAATYLPFRAPR